jgi:hypothetical protein
MTIFPLMLLLIFILFLILGFIMACIRKGASGVKIMLLGLSITIFGGIIAVDPSSSLGGVEYIISLFGLIISAIGLGKKD